MKGVSGLIGGGLALAGALACGGLDASEPRSGRAAPAPPAARREPPPPPAGTPPNVLLILLDDVGLDLVGFGGAPGPSAPTPRLDALAARGVWFRQAWANPSCSPARAGLMTGRLPGRHGFGTIAYFNKDEHYLQPGELTLPERLKQAPTPYSTLILGKWHLTSRAEPDFLRSPLQHGFDHHFGPMDNLELIIKGEKEREPDYFSWQKVEDGKLRWTERYATSDLVDDALTWLPTMPEPWLGYLAFAAPHSPYHWPPPELAPQSPRRGEGKAEAWQVRAMLEAADTEIGRLLDGLPPELLARTTVILAGDNGTSPKAVLPPLDPKRAKTTVYDGGLRVPLVVTGPAVARPAVSDALVDLTDLLPTLEALAGVRPDLPGPDGAPPPPRDGVSLVPLLAKPELPGREVLFAEEFQPNGPGPYREHHLAARSATHKLIRFADGREELFAYDPSRPWDEGPVRPAADWTPADRAAREQLAEVLRARADGGRWAW